MKEKPSNETEMNCCSFAIAHNNPTIYRHEMILGEERDGGRKRERGKDEECSMIVFIMKLFFSFHFTLQYYENSDETIFILFDNNKIST